MWSINAVERQLAHAAQNKVKGAYGRGGRFEERMWMMQWWAKHLDTVAKSPPRWNPEQRCRLISFNSKCCRLENHDAGCIGFLRPSPAISIPSPQVRSR